MLKGLGKKSAKVFTYIRMEIGAPIPKYRILSTKQPGRRELDRAMFLTKL